MAFIWTHSTSMTGSLRSKNVNSVPNAHECTQFGMEAVFNAGLEMAMQRAY